MSNLPTNTARPDGVIQPRAGETATERRTRAQSHMVSSTPSTPSPTQAANDSVTRQVSTPANPNSSSHVANSSGLDAAQTSTDPRVAAALGRLKPGEQSALNATGRQIARDLAAVPIEKPIGTSTPQRDALIQTAYNNANTGFGDFVSSTGNRMATDQRQGIGEQVALGESFDIGAYVQYVLRDAYNSTTEDLGIFAKKTKWLNDLKKEIRNELERARKVATSTNVATLPDTGTLTPPVDTKNFNSDPTAAGGTFSVAGEPLTTKAQLKTYIENLEQKLQTVGDDAQLAQVDLQIILQKQQQTLQLMSNISKMLHDTSMSIIRKIG